MNSAYAIKELPLPVVLSHNSQGVGDVDVADPSKPLEVLVGPVRLSQRDRIDLFWGANDDVIDSYTHAPGAPDTNGIFTLHVTTNLIQPGVADVRYTYVPYPSEIPEPSPVKKVIVKLDLPGGRDPDPATPYENEKLALPTVNPAGVITSPEGITVVIAPYENMVEGDVISVFWHGIKLEYSPLTTGQVGKPVTLDIGKDTVIEAGDSENIVVRYEIRDVVNNWSRFSLPTFVEVEAGNSSLPAPIAPQAPNMELNLDHLAGEDVQALVLSHPDIAVGDTINFTAERNTAEGIPLTPYTASKVVQAPVSFIEFLIPNQQFLPIAQGRARFKYNVAKPSGETLLSKSLPLSVLGQVQQLALPIVPAAVDGLLDPTEPRVLAQVPPYHFMADGNDVKLVWIGKTASGATVLHEEIKTLNAADVGKTVEYLIPDEKVSVLAGGSLEVYYTVTTYMKAFFKSPVLQLRVDVDNSVPLPAPSVDHVDAEGVLNPADIVLEAVVRVSPYPAMAEGDKVTLQWYGSNPDGTYSTYTVINSGTVNKQVIFRVPKRYVDSNLDGTIQVWYEVLKEGRTLVSARLPIAVRGTPLPPLPAPLVKEAQGDTLDPADAPNGATVVIDASAKLKAGERVFVVWNGPKGYGEKDLTVTESQAGKTLEVIFAASLVTDNVGERVRIRYAVYRHEGPMQKSETIGLNIRQSLPALPVPAVDYVNADGVLDPADILGEAITRISPYPSMTAGDQITLHWAGSQPDGSYGATTVVDSGSVNKEVVFKVPKRHVDANLNGSIEVWYEVKRGDLTLPSDRLPILVRELPSLPLPNPFVKEAVGDTLDPADATGGATVIVDANARLRVGERVFVVWQGPKGYGEKDLIVNESQAGKTLEVLFAASLVSDNAGERVLVRYAVYRLNGSMQKSETISVTVLDTVTEVPAPSIKEATGDVLDPANAAHGATVVIDAGAKLRAGDKVLVIWDGPKGYDSKEKTVTADEAGKTLEVVFAAALVQANIGQTVAYAYAVYRASGGMQRSRTVTVKILGAISELPAPRMPGVGADGVLLPSLIPESGATVQVNYPGMGAQDSVVVNWRGASSYETPAQVGNGSELQFNLPKALITATIGASASVTYTVMRAGIARVSATLWLTVREELGFDTSPVTLAGKIYLMPGAPDLLPAFPAGTTVQRQASGGLGPYTYRSSDALVAVVDGDGLTSVRGNGQATISVTDAQGQRKHYEVTVTGVVHCLGVGGGKYSQISAAAAAIGARIPSITELKEIYAAYGNRWPMGNAYYWSSTVAAQNLVGWKWYYVKNLVTGIDFKLLHHSASLGVAIR